MNRRTALKHAALLAGGAMVLPSFGFSAERVEAALSNLKIDAKLQSLLARIIDTLIPSGETLGALDLKLDQFVPMMLNDCESKETQEQFIQGLKQFPTFVKDRFDQSFIEGSQVFREQVLAELQITDKASDHTSPADIREFLSLTKHYTILGFRNSEYVMTELFPYNLVPGPFQACVSNEQDPLQQWPI